MAATPETNHRAIQRGAALFALLQPQNARPPRTPFALAFALLISLPSAFATCAVIMIPTQSSISTRVVSCSD